MSLLFGQEIEAVGLAAVDDVVEIVGVMEVAELKEPVAEEVMTVLLPEDDVDDDDDDDDGEVPLLVPFNAYIDRRPEPPQYSVAFPAQVIVHPLVWSLPDAPEPGSTLIAFPQ